MIGKNIRRIRAELNLKQEDIALDLNVTRETISNWERDVSSPDILMLRKLKLILNCSYDELLEEYQN